MHSLSSPLFVSPKKDHILKGAKGEKKMERENTTEQVVVSKPVVTPEVFSESQKDGIEDRENLQGDLQHQLYRVWRWDSNDRWEVSRIKALSFEQAVEFLKSYYIKPEYLEDILETELGIEWDECDPKECKKLYKTNYDPEFDGEYDPESVCDMCSDPDIRGFSLEEVEEPEEDDYSYKTIHGTNEYFDLTVNGMKKAEDWDSLLSRAWEKDSQLGVAALLLSSATPREALSDELYERSKKDLQDAGLME